MCRSILALLLLGCTGKGDDTGGTVAPPDTDPQVWDPLSMPEDPTLDLADFTPSSECAGCHPTHHAEWQSSMHAYAMVDPVYRGLVAVRQDHLDNTEDLFCTQCHSPIGNRSGDIRPGFSFEELDPITLEGVNCETCHTVSHIERPYNAGHVLDAGGVRGPIEDPADNSFHDRMEYSPDFENAEFCGACHDVVETSGLPLERPYEEWTTSPAATEGRDCQSCHMPEYQAAAAVGGPERTTHSHRFVGVDVPLLDGWASVEDVDVIRGQVEALLGAAASLDLQAPSQVERGEQLDLVITVRNDIEAHNFPTGSTFLRQAWLEVTATDAKGRVLYRTGDLDANGDLRDHWSELDPYGDDDLITFGSGFVDDGGDLTLFTHLAAEHTSTALAPLYERTFTLFVPTDEETVGPIGIDVRLRFRSFAPYLLRLLELDGELAPVEIYDIDMVTGAVAVP